ncbi:MAG: TolC family protein, partial [Ramlibacter sp.]
MFRSSLVRLIAAACLSSVVAPAWPQQALNLPEAQRLAVARSRQVTAQDAEAAAVREMARAAGQLPDPVLKLGIDNLPVNGPDRLSLSRDFMTMRRIGVMQEIPRADKRRLKVERLDRDAQRVQAEREQTVAGVQRDTALAWIDRYYALAMLELLRQQVEETRLQIEGGEMAYRIGRGSQADIFAARASLASM